MAVTLLTHPACQAYDLPPPYPDRARRLSAIEDGLIAAGLEGLLPRQEAPEAGDKELSAVHAPEYIAMVAEQEPARGSASLDGDTLLVPGIGAAARRAAGAGLAGVDTVVDGGGSVFALTRPPGHHARRGASGGFCLFNNAALAASRARQKGIERVAVVDFDAHHGDGTEALVAADNGVRLFSLYEAGGFQAPEAGTGPGGSLRLALPRGGDGGDLRSAVGSRLAPALAAFRPQFLVVSAGFDGHREDDLSGLQLAEGDYAWLAGEILDSAGPATGGQGLFLLEGGYAPEALGRSVAAVIKKLI